MRMSNRRESDNVEDRRGMSGATKAGIGGIGGLLIAGLLMLLGGGNISDVLNMAVSQMGNTETVSAETFSEEQQELATFSSKVLAGTEDVWTKIFEQNGWEYKAPTMVLFTNSVQTGCGGATSQVGPFYCSADEKLYIDLTFFSEMQSQLGASGDFAYAYVIAHEVGHHVEHMTGILSQAHQQMQKMSTEQANRISVRLELLADFYAGVWAHHDNKMFNSLEDGDIEEAIRCAQVIGDDYLQKKARGYAQPESFTHGTSAQRLKWFKLGYQTGDISRGNTFQLSDSQLYPTDTTYKRHARPD